MHDLDKMWEKVFISGKDCLECLFSEPRLTIEPNKKIMVRECVVNSPHYCPGVKRKINEDALHGK